MQSLMQKAHEETKWCYLSGQIKALEKELVSNAQYQSLISARDHHELLRSLSDSPYKSVLRQEEDLFDYEKILNAQLSAKLDWIERYSPQPIVYHYFKVRGDIQDLKARIKSYISKIPQDEELSEKRIEEEQLKEQLYGSAFDHGEIPLEYHDAYMAIVQTYREKKILQSIDFEADRQMLAILHKVADASSNEMMKSYTTAFIELKNLCALVRLKALGVPGDMLPDILFIPPQSELKLGLAMDSMRELYEAPRNTWPVILALYGYQNIFIEYGTSPEGSPTLEIEKKCDDFLMDILRRAKYIPFGIEVAFAYMASFLVEIVNIKIIVIAKLNNLTEGVISAKVRRGYV